MSQSSARPVALPPADLSPLGRTDLPSFLVALPAGTIIEATPAAAARGLIAGTGAPADVARAALALSGRSGLVRLRLPGAFVPRLFRYEHMTLPRGAAVLFADPATSAEAPATRPVPAVPPPTGMTPMAMDPGPSALQPVRITFETDVDDRLSRLSPPFAAALGQRAETFLGRTFAQLEEAGLLTSGGALATAFASGGSFSDVKATVAPRTPEDAALELDLGGVPVLDAARRRRFLRGFGVLRALPRRARAARPALPLIPDLAPDHHLAENVVPLRGGTLSPQERSAFREIARTLAAAIEDWPKPRLDETPAAPADAEEAEGRREASLLDRLPVGLVVQQEGELTYANRTLLALAGWDSLDDLRTAGGLGRMLEREADGSLFLVTADDRRLPVEVRLVASPFMGRPALLHVIRPFDAADARESRAAARRAALDMVPWPVFLLEKEGTIRLCNTAAEARFGFSPLDLAGEPFTLAIAPEDRAAAVAALDRVAAAAATEELDVRLRDRSGETFATRIGIARAGADLQMLCVVVGPALPPPAPMASPAPLAPVAVAEPPDQLPRLARRLMESLGRPVATALGYARSETPPSPMPVEVREALSTLQRSLDDLSALTAPPEEAAPVPCDLAALARAAVAALQPEACRRRVVLRPDLADRLSVPSHAPRLTRLVRLMIEEGLRATPAGGSVAISLFEEAGHACLLVCDGGASLDEVSRATALAPLSVEAGADADRFSASGQPLLAARLAADAQALGGAFEIRPDVTRGMIARLTLPLA
ncbi:PAS domain-containing protein [Xanthobacter autotrophicus DSM 431]|uniref:PAS domain S-box protein n=1 Tax=Xanthobacter nonsaccharivorans TaxID=3119912 RepID=UPI00372C1E89